MQVLIKISSSTCRETPFMCHTQWISSCTHTQSRLAQRGNLMLCAKGHGCCIIPGVTNESWHTKRNGSLFGMLMWEGERKHRRLVWSPWKKDQFAPIGSSHPWISPDSPTGRTAASTWDSISLYTTYSSSCFLSPDSNAQKYRGRFCGRLGAVCQ